LIDLSLQIFIQKIIGESILQNTPSTNQDYDKMGNKLKNGMPRVPFNILE